MDLVLARLHTVNNNNTSFITCIYSSPPAPVTSSLFPLATTTKVKSSKLTDKKKQSPLLLALYFFQLEAHRLGISSDNDTSLPVCNSEVRLGLPAYIWKAMPVVCSKGYVYVANHSQYCYVYKYAIRLSSLAITNALSPSVVLIHTLLRKLLQGKGTAGMEKRKTFLEQVVVGILEKNNRTLQFAQGNTMREGFQLLRCSCRQYSWARCNKKRLGLPRDHRNQSKQ